MREVVAPNERSLAHTHTHYQGKMCNVSILRGEGVWPSAFVIGMDHDPTKESNHAAIHKLKIETEGQNDTYHKKLIRGLSK